MNLPADLRLVQRAARAQRGVFTKADLQVLLGEKHPAAFARRVDALARAGGLQRFCRGFYVAEEFDLPTLSQRIEPASTVSFGTVLVRALLIGTRPDRQVIATKPGGRSRSYTGLGVEVVHLRVAAHLDFGYRVERGVRFAEPEKAVLDVLSFHLRGRRYPFDVYSDIDYARLDRAKLEQYLDRYRNPKFATFVRKLLHW
ncbi:MAG: hypothetical protein IPM29_28455 [Planctomycetes bacterium]|nr:hypothetical protein [Planctomycetota bacterium]